MEKLKGDVRVVINDSFFDKLGDIIEVVDILIALLGIDPDPFNDPDPDPFLTPPPKSLARSSTKTKWYFFLIFKENRFILNLLP